MDQAIAPLQFSGKHQILFAIHVDDDKDGLRIGPRRPEIRNFWRLMGWMLLVLSVALVVSLVMSFNPDGPMDRHAKAVPLLIVFLGAPITYVLVGLLWAAAYSDFEKGPVLVFDRGRRVVALPRLKSEVRVDELIAVGCLTGWYVNPSNYACWNIELSLIVVQDDQPPMIVAFLMDSSSKRMEKMAEQVATALGCPLRRERLGGSG